MSQVAREHGFQGHFLSALSDPAVGLAIGCAVLEAKLAAGGGTVPRGLALWNGGGNPYVRRALHVGTPACITRSHAAESRPERRAFGDVTILVSTSHSVRTTALRQPRPQQHEQSSRLLAKRAESSSFFAALVSYVRPPRNHPTPTPPLPIDFREWVLCCFDASRIGFACCALFLRVEARGLADTLGVPAFRGGAGALCTPGVAGLQRSCVFLGGRLSRRLFLRGVATIHCAWGCVLGELLPSRPSFRVSGIGLRNALRSAQFLGIRPFGRGHTVYGLPLVAARRGG
jgi:hypothetical protein